MFYCSDLAGMCALPTADEVLYEHVLPVEPPMVGKRFVGAKLCFVVPASCRCIREILMTSVDASERFPGFGVNSRTQLV